MLTAKQAAEKLQISLSQIYKLVSNGELQCYRIGKAIRISEEQLTCYLDHVQKQVKKLTYGKHFLLCVLTVFETHGYM